MYYNNKKLVLSVFWAIMGIALIVLSITEVLNSPIYAGIGGSLTAVGIHQAIRNLKYRKDPDYRKKVDTEIQDERNSFLRMKSWACAGYIMLFVEGIGAIAAIILNQRTIQLILSYSVCMLLAAYWISYLILSKKY